MDEITPVSAVIVDFESFRAARAAARGQAEAVAEQRTFDWDVLGPVDALIREVRQAPHRARMLRHLTGTALCSGHVPSE
jgi:hypothetical protein